MNRQFFITGTDTGAGKTRFTTSLMQLIKDGGESVCGMKPIASGACKGDAGLQNDDVLEIQKHASFPLSYDSINSYTFEPAISPHLAAKKSNICIDFTVIRSTLDKLSARSDYVLVEGVGGWLAPLRENGQTVADLALYLQMPIILVVGIKLGCLNHAMLTVNAIRNSGASLQAWAGSCIDPGMEEIDANIAYLKKHIHAPCLGILPYNPEQAAVEQIKLTLSLAPLKNAQ